MEGTLAFGGERWLRDLGTAKSGLVLERWWVDHRLRTVAIGGGGNKLTRKGSEKGEAIPSSLKIVGFLSYCFWVMICLLNCSFFKNLIQNKGIGHSRKHFELIILFLRNPN